MTEYQDRWDFNFWAKGIQTGKEYKYEEKHHECYICRNFCFIAYVSCACDPTKFYCMEHSKGLCQCPPQKRMIQHSAEYSKLKNEIVSACDVN
eukprot:CAMPEP_0184501214 /NCGR_PEP_ID=MMETSP0113_2-20130426/47025_1 /TAXON_ID=91329 /ORGANISM="Norrisiella sphaerica, Strain BC52" /LENGTH=92 /DNA_ID=CAMNT_0026889901 /DNA_START=54 /DNA_END=332 /DNA_ORIENTATION=+